MQTCNRLMFWSRLAIAVSAFALVFPSLVQAGPSSEAMSGEGQGVGNGGDPMAQEFVTLARSAVDLLESRASQVPYIDVKAVRDFVDRTSIHLVERPLFSVMGGEVTAINLPAQGLIEINRTRWKSIGDSRRRKMALAIHEYLGIAGYEVNNYRITSWLFGITEKEIQYGRLASIKNGSNYRFMDDLRKKPFWFHFEMDLERRTMLLTNARNVTIKLECGGKPYLLDDECYTVDFQEQLAQSNFIGAPSKAGRNPPYIRMSVLPDGNLVLSYWEKDPLSWEENYQGISELTSPKNLRKLVPLR